MERILKENIIKNIILIVLLVLLISPINEFLLNNKLFEDVYLAGDVLVAMSIIAVIACFGNFAFSYEKINPKNVYQRYLAHITTGLLMFIIGVSLIFTSILISFIMGYFFLVDLILSLLYLSCMGYDFWDVMRISG